MQTTPEPPHDLLLRLAPGLFVLLWSSGYIGAKFGLPYAEPFTFLVLRFVPAAVLLALIALIGRAPWPRGMGLVHSMVAGALIHGLYLGGAFWAMALGMPAGVTALIFGLQPLMTAVLAGLLLGERVAAIHWLGLGLGLAGLALVIGPRLDATGSGITPFTVALVAGGVLGITLGTLYQKRFAVGTGLRAGGALQYVGACAVCGLAALSLESGAVAWTLSFVLALAWLILALSIGAMLLLMLLIRHGAVSKVAANFYLVAPVTALMGWVLLGETLSLVQLVGMGVTVAGVALAQRE